jgi:predicted nucleic acid-binding protein
MARVTRYLVDASMLIHLDRIGELLLLRDLVGKVLVTAEVAEEVRAGPYPLDLKAARFRGWVALLPTRKQAAHLGLGKGETSLLVSARPGDRLLLDDAQARAVAEARGLEYVGLLGLLIAGTESRLVPAHRALEILDALVATEFRLSPTLYARARKQIEDVE